MAVRQYCSRASYEINTFSRVTIYEWSFTSVKVLLDDTVSFIDALFLMITHNPRCGEGVYLELLAVGSAHYPVMLD